jgi:hypothetical protein
VVKKQKPHRRSGSGVLESFLESEPNRRAAKQRVRKQQVQIQVSIHGGKVVSEWMWVN